MGKILADLVWASVNIGNAGADVIGPDSLRARRVAKGIRLVRIFSVFGDQPDIFPDAELEPTPETGYPAAREGGSGSSTNEGDNVPQGKVDGDVERQGHDGADVIKAHPQGNDFRQRIPP